MAENNLHNIRERGADLFVQTCRLDFPEEIMLSLQGKPLGHLALGFTVSRNCDDVQGNFGDLTQWLMVAPLHDSTELRDEKGSPFADYKSYLAYLRGSQDEVSRFNGTLLEELRAKPEVRFPLSLVGFSFEYQQMGPGPDDDDKWGCDLPEDDLSFGQKEAVINYMIEAMECMKRIREGLELARYDAERHTVTYVVADGVEVRIMLSPVLTSPYLPLNGFEDPRFVRNYKNEMYKRLNDVLENVAGHLVDNIADRSADNQLFLAQQAALEQLYRDAIARVDAALGD